MEDARLRNCDDLELYVIYSDVPDVAFNSEPLARTFGEAEIAEATTSGSFRDVNSREAMT